MKSSTPKTTSRRREVSTPPVTSHHASLARQLDRLADHNLHLGFHLAAERLARQAAELREVRR